jgi:hypothetical protein
MSSVAEKVRRERELGGKLFQYAGRWVAVIDYAVERDAATLDELLEQLDEHERRSAEILRVSEHPDAIHLY